MKSKRRKNKEVKQSRTTVKSNFLSCIKSGCQKKRRGHNTAFCDWITAEEKHEGRFHLNIAAVCCRCSASTVVSFCGLLQYSIHVCVQENTHVACPLPVLVSAAHYMSTEPKSSLSCTSVLNCPLMQCKANIFEFLLICFCCCLFSKT